MKQGEFVYFLSRKSNLFRKKDASVYFPYRKSICLPSKEEIDNTNPNTIVQNVSIRKKKRFCNQKFVKNTKIENSELGII